MDDGSIVETAGEVEAAGTHQDADEQDALKLGGNIVLSGFREIDGGTMIVLKKIVGNYARRFADRSQNFELLSVNMSKIHERETSAIFEIRAKLIDNGKPSTSQFVDRNIFVAVDSVLKKLESQ